MDNNADSSDSTSSDHDDVEMATMGNKQQSKAFNPTQGFLDDDVWAQTLSTPPQQIHVEFDDLCYHVVQKKGKFCRRRSEKKHIIKNMSGCIAPGELCVILGPTGAGKTTLLNIIAGRVRNNVKGTLNFNGEPRTKGVKRKTAFIMQEDIFFSELNAGETLELTARLVLPRSMTSEQKTQKSEDALDMFRLRKAAKTIVGDPFKRGLSGGEKKRLNIANELMNPNASLILMDEPTSGLDSATALDVVDLMKRLTETGRSVVATLHQPSSQMYDMFDKIIILADGKIAYIGTPMDALPHFEELGYVCPTRYNPADFFLQLVQDHTDDQEVILDGWANKAHPATDPKEIPPPLSSSTVSSKFPTPLYEQFYLLWRRAWKQHASMVIRQAVVFMMIAVLASIVWFQTGDEFPDDVNDRFGLLFFVSIQWLIFAMFGTINTFIPEKGVVRKERAIGMYRLSCYFLAKQAAEFFQDIITPIIFTTLVYWATGLNDKPERFFICVGLVFMAFLCGQSLGLFFAAIFEDIRFASVVNMVYFFVAQLTAGFFVSIDNIPVWFRWTQYMTPMKYLYDSMIINEFSGQTFTVEDGEDENGNTGKIGGTTIIEENDPIFDSIIYNVLVLFGFIFVFRLAAYFILRWKTKIRN